MIFTLPKSRSSSPITALVAALWLGCGPGGLDVAPAADEVAPPSPRAEPAGQRPSSEPVSVQDEREQDTGGDPAAEGRAGAARPSEPPASESPPSDSPPSGVVEVTTTPPGAEVYDTGGVLLGRTPLGVSRVELPRELVLRRDEHRDWTLTITAMTQRYVHVTLEPDRPALSARQPLPAGPLPWASMVRPGVGDLYAVRPGVIGMRQAEVLRRLGPPARRHGRRWFYRWGSTCGLPEYGLELTVREGRVTRGRGYHNDRHVIDCVEEVSGGGR